MSRCSGISTHPPPSPPLPPPKNTNHALCIFCGASAFRDQPQAVTEHEHPQQVHSRRQTPRPPNNQQCAGFYTPGLRCSPSALCMPSDVPGTATEIDQNHMQYVAVRARGASKPFLSCIVSDLKRTLRASTGLQRILYDINLAAQSTVRWNLFSFPAASPGHGPVQKMETSRKLIWLFGG